MSRLFQTIPSRVLVLMIVVGMLAPMAPSAQRHCIGAPEPEPERCAVQADEAASCCAGKGEQQAPEQDNGSTDEDCCAGDCACMCCVIMPVPVMVLRAVSNEDELMPTLDPCADRGTECRAQDAVGALLRPPQA